MLLLTWIDTTKHLGKAQKNAILALLLVMGASMEIKAAEKVNGLFVTKNCEMLVVGILNISFCPKGRE